MTTIDPAQLFHDPGNGVCGLFEYVFKIFKSQWKTFLGISLFQAGSVTIIYVFFFLIFAASQIESTLERSLTSYSSARFLLEQTIGIGIPSRFLNEAYDDDYYNDDFDDDFDDGYDDVYSAEERYYELVYIIYDYLPKPLNRIFAASLNMGFDSMSKRASILTMIFSFLVIESFIKTIFKGALIRATAETYAGFTPGIFSSLQTGIKYIWSIFCFNFLLISTLATVGLLFVFAPTFGTKSPYVLGFTAIIYLLFFIMVCSATVGAVPSIVIEKKSPYGAFCRSRDLCGFRFIGFIFRAIFFFSFLEMGCSSIIFMILYFTPEGLGIVTQFILQMVLIPLNSILVVVIYNTLRIRREEGYSQRSLLQELSLSPPMLENSSDLNLTDEKINDAECV
uniref:Uncharacterized protein n=1 Tax=Corethron hystrix TaxID=216773 RepID=A0A7S1BH87_9STRA|mmetsp:Transcript_28188/g.64485  ORF Transcript_28188/g.64485 Transcript_28188/m.64485 type:complete len:394 (+) Transcript_28188:206-1387(+)